MSKIDEILSRVSDEVKELVKKAYSEGFNDGLGVKLPTQAEFDKNHKIVQPYGEESDWLVLSKELYTEEQAQRRFKKYLKAEFGWDGEEITNCLETMQVRWIGYHRADDEGEPGYWIGRDKPTYWAAWVVETQ